MTYSVLFVENSACFLNFLLKAYISYIVLSLYIGLATILSNFETHSHWYGLVAILASTA